MMVMMTNHLLSSHLIILEEGMECLRYQLLNQPHI
jgi:hypothetical protein